MTRGPDCAPSSCPGLLSRFFWGSLCSPDFSRTSSPSGPPGYGSGTSCGDGSRVGTERLRARWAHRPLTGDVLTPLPDAGLPQTPAGDPRPCGAAVCLRPEGERSEGHIPRTHAGPGRPATKSSRRDRQRPLCSRSLTFVCGSLGPDSAGLRRNVGRGVQGKGKHPLEPSCPCSLLAPWRGSGGHQPFPSKRRPHSVRTPG